MTICWFFLNFATPNLFLTLILSLFDWYNLIETLLSEPPKYQSTARDDTFMSVQFKIRKIEGSKNHLILELQSTTGSYGIETMRYRN